jgi:hypothetical protein
MTDEQPQDPNAGTVGPGPLPTTFHWEPMIHPQAGAMVMLRCATPAGVGVYFVPPAMARGLASGLNQAADAADAAAVGNPAGIIVPNVDVGAVLKTLENGKGKRR